VFVLRDLRQMNHPECCWCCAGYWL
jgi:hypothetical protein